MEKTKNRYRSLRAAIEELSYLQTEYPCSVLDEIQEKLLNKATAQNNTYQSLVREARQHRYEIRSLKHVIKMLG